MRLCRGALRCELAERYGQDLSVLLAQPAGAVRTVLDFVDGLPRHNRIIEALHNDPHYAAMVVQARQAAEEAAFIDALDPDGEQAEGVEPGYGQWSPSMAEYGLQNQQLHDQRALLVRMIDDNRAANGHKPSGIPRFPSPRTLVDTLIEQNRRRDYQAGLAIFTPHAFSTPG